jgi:rhodanese-related sulfurtransferase
MAVDVNSEDGLIIRKLIPLVNLPGAHFAKLCAEMTVEEIQDQPLFKKGDVDPRLIYLLRGELALQAEGLVVEVISADSESARFALAHQIPRKIDAVANGSVRFLRLGADIVNHPEPLVYKEDNSYMVIEEPDDDQDDWMTTLLRSPIFQRLPPANLQKILIGLESVQFNKGDTIVSQGEAGDYYYLVKSGKCLLTRKPSPNAKDIKLGELSKGDTFGEDALLSDEPRNVTVTALTDINLLRLDKSKFITLIKNPALKFVDYAELQEALSRGAILLDVRSPDEYATRHLNDSINMPFFTLRMQLKTLSREKTVIVVCGNGKASEAAAFLLLRHKFNAMILKGGMESAPSDVENQTAFFDIDDGIETLDVRVEEFPLVKEVEQAVDDLSGSLDSNLEAQVRFLKSENDTLRKMNHQLNDKCVRLEIEKDDAEKQCRMLQKQIDKLTQMLAKLKES